MLPEKYVNEVERHEKQQYAFKHGLIGFLLLSSMYIFGPIIHEYSHILWLELQNCYFTTDFGFSPFRGLTGSVKPMCYLSLSSQVVFYSIGYISTVLVGGSLAILGDIQHRKKDYLLSTGIGMLLSVLLTVNTKGDMARALNALGVEPSNFMIVSAFITIGLLGTSLKAVEELLKNLEREE
jgi:hypothetical protein